MALSEFVEAWRTRHAGEVVGISGLEHLREGRYPEMEIWMGCMNDNTIFAPGWVICPVRVTTQGALFDLGPSVACLEDELPRELYSYIGTLMPD